MTLPAGRHDEGGAVFVEKLIVYLPMLMTFFAAWELAELGAAHLVTQRACAAAGRAAMVVLGDDPAFYDGEPTGSFDGQRRADIELAAGMILSAIPRMSEDFSVELGEGPSDLGDVFDLSLTASYDCGLVSMICGGDDAIELTATSQHTYHGAKYPYSSPSIAGGDAALTANFNSGERDGAYEGDGEDEEEWQWRSGFRAVPFTGCGKGKGAAAYPGTPNHTGTHLGTQTTTQYGGADNLSYEALRHRCQQIKDKKPVGFGNVAVIKYECNGVEGVVAAASDGKKHSEPNVYAKFEAATSGKSGCKVIEFYTEREPCDDGANCAGYISKLPPEVKNKVTFHFDYNPKRSVDTANDPYYAQGKQACTAYKKQYEEWFKNNKGCKKNPNADNCAEIDRWAKANGKGNDPNVKKCLEFLQAKKDFADDGPRKQFEKDTKKAYKKAEKDCKTKFPEIFSNTDADGDTVMGGT